MKNNYFIIHGSFGSPFVNWVPYIRKEIEEKKWCCLYTRFSNWGWISKL